MKRLSQHCATSGGLSLSEQPDSIVTQFCYNNNNHPLAKKSDVKKPSKISR